MTGTHRFQTGFNCLTDIQVKIQKAKDYISIGLENAYCFLDDILIVSKEPEEDHKQNVLNCLKRLYVKNLRYIPKCHFSKLAFSINHSLCG